MKILQVQIQVKPEAVPQFISETLANARGSIAEPGVMRFDVCQQTDDPTRFVLLEIYRADADHAAHRETAHYLRWRDAVASMMAEPRKGTQYRRLFPEGSDA